MLRPDEIESVVGETLAAIGDFEISRRVAGSEVTLGITRAGSVDGSRIQTRIVTSGVEAFFVYLDDRYVFRDFDWERNGQLGILALTARLAAAYLAGDGEEGVEKRWFGRKREVFTMKLDGVEFRMDAVRVRRPD